MSPELIVYREHSKSSERVRSAMRAGWTSLADGLAAITWWRMEHRVGRGEHRGVSLLVAEHEIQVSISPACRSVQIFVDGERVT